MSFFCSKRFLKSWKDGSRSGRYTAPLNSLAPSLPFHDFWRLFSGWNFFISTAFYVLLEALTNGEVWYCWCSTLCDQAVKPEKINTESGLPVSCWMKLEGVQIQKDFLAYRFWATHSNSHLKGQLPDSISDCLTALRTSFYFGRSCWPDLGDEALFPDRRDQRGDRVGSEVV